MAKNEIKVNITAETTQFERNIVALKKKLGEAFLTPNQFSIGAAPNSSYTIGGRTFTKANLSDSKKHLEPLAEYLFPRDPPLDRPRLPRRALLATALASVCRRPRRRKASPKWPLHFLQLPLTRTDRRS